MNTLELNLAAKPVYNKALANKRRNDMRKWRTYQHMQFNNMADFNKWLDYTKWHKRPVEIIDHKWLVMVKFLDWKAK